MTKVVAVAPSKGKILEQGDIFFFYRPKVRSTEQPAHQDEALENIQRFYLVLAPEKQALFRFILIGRKKLPEVQERGETHWATIEKVASNPQAIVAELQGERYSTKTRGERLQPAARAVGEGVYCIASHNDHTHLAYALELPQQPRKIQFELGIAPEASYIVSVKNQAVAGSTVGRTADFPANLKKKMGDRRFLSPDSTDFFNYENVELLLISTTADAERELGIQFNTEAEKEDTAEIFTRLKLWKQSHTIAPLFKS